MRLVYISYLNFFFLSLPFDVVHSLQIRIAATNALLNSLEFTKQNFDREVGVILDLRVMVCTVKPLLSGHPKRNKKWLLERGWLLIK